MTTALDLDITALVGEQEDQSCEHSRHTTSDIHNDQPATHYVRASGRCNCPATDAYAACPSFTAFIRSATLCICSGCGTIAPSNQLFDILAPIKGTQS